MTDHHEIYRNEVIALIKRCVRIVHGYVPCDKAEGRKVYWTPHGLLLLDENFLDTGFFFHNNQVIFVIKPGENDNIVIGIIGGERDWKSALSEMSSALLSTVVAEDVSGIKCPKMIELAKDQYEKATTLMENNKVTWLTQ